MTTHALPVLELNQEQASKSQFPPDCPVYICDDSESPPGIDAQGIVLGTLLQVSSTSNGTYDTYYKVCVKTKGIDGLLCSREETVHHSKLRYKNGCRVKIKPLETAPGKQSDTETEFETGTVLGMYDCPTSDDNKYRYKYAVHVQSKGIYGYGYEDSIQHDVLPEQLSYVSDVDPSSSSCQANEDKIEYSENNRHNQAQDKVDDQSETMCISPNDDNVVNENHGNVPRCINVVSSDVTDLTSSNIMTSNVVPSSLDGGDSKREEMSSNTVVDSANGMNMEKHVISRQSPSKMREKKISFSPPIKLDKLQNDIVTNEAKHKEGKIRNEFMHVKSNVDIIMPEMTNVETCEYSSELEKQRNHRDEERKKEFERSEISENQGKGSFLDEGGLISDTHLRSNRKNVPDLRYDTKDEANKKRLMTRREKRLFSSEAPTNKKYRNGNHYLFKIQKIPVDFYDISGIIIGRNGVHHRALLDATSTSKIELKRENIDECSVLVGAGDKVVVKNAVTYILNTLKRDLADGKSIVSNVSIKDVTEDFMHAPNRTVSNPFDAVLVDFADCLSGKKAFSRVAPTIIPVKIFNGVNPVFQPYQDVCLSVGLKKIKSKIKAGQLPALPMSKVYDGPMCLPYHIKGICMNSCGCRQDHATYTTEEYQGLLDWWSIANISLSVKKINQKTSEEKQKRYDDSIPAWKKLPPKDGEPQSMINNGKEFFYCKKCRNGKGMWALHKIEQHTSNYQRPPRAKKVAFPS
mmetsp:Transcript_11555/g.13423  ORF Transcript_11555/g.13423 Transcript_11555/m.13423 type:complete len:747 (+) Transcript_11555:85-2325(+)